MNDADLELRWAAWLKSEGAAVAVPDGLRRRIASIPSAGVAPRTRGWLRFQPLMATAAAVVVLSVVVTLTLQNLTPLIGTDQQVPPGTCRNDQVQRAFSELLNSEGYRYEVRHETYGFDPSVPPSIDDPQYAWLGSVASGAYRAPDRLYERVESLEGASQFGYEEYGLIGGSAWALTTPYSPSEEEPQWQEYPADRNPNAAYQAIAEQGGQLTFGAGEVPEGLPGTGGCTSVALLEGSDTPCFDGVTGAEIPCGDEGHGPQVLVVRVDPERQLLLAAYSGPAAGEPIERSTSRDLWELTHEVPAEAEFVAPADVVEAPQIPEPSPAGEPDPSAWQPTRLPVPEDGSRAFPNAATATDDAVVVVGSAEPACCVEYDPERVYGFIWLSTDGGAWEAVERPDGFQALSLFDVAWDGEELITLGYRLTEPMTVEAWRSSDGRAWERASSLPSGSVNDIAVVGSGWMAAGGVELEPGADGEGATSPAVFASSDGREWTTTELGGASGSVSRVLATDDDRLVAIACETPDAAPDACLTRVWTSTDGVSWTPGAILNGTVSDIEARDDGLLAIGPRLSGNGAVVWQSPDGEEWIEREFDTAPNASLSGLTATPNGWVMTGSVPELSGFGETVAWRSSEGVEWEPYASLARPEGAVRGGAGPVLIYGPDGVMAFGAAAETMTSNEEAVVWLAPE